MLLLINSYVKESNIVGVNLSEIYFVDKMDGDTFRVTHQMIDKYQ